MTTSASQEFPEARRVITIETDAKTMEKMRKEGVTEDGFTVYCDEAERLGGDNSAPSPMRYLSLSLGF
ncbi:MAG: hypothetical protein IIC95_02040 [Chloroflexi bacterium]|nr:hypothetical protein [Chloroflexota bacterium]MCH7654750.1 hypothetical protein [Chloroflexota bacterium]